MNVASNGYRGFPEPSELVKQITKMEKDLAEMSSELGQIRATLLVNFGSQGRGQDGFRVDGENLSTLQIMVHILREYSVRLSIAEQPHRIV